MLRNLYRQQTRSYRFCCQWVTIRIHGRHQVYPGRINQFAHFGVTQPPFLTKVISELEKQFPSQHFIPVHVAYVFELRMNYKISKFYVKSFIIHSKGICLQTYAFDGVQGCLWIRWHIKVPQERKFLTKCKLWWCLDIGNGFHRELWVVPRSNDAWKRNRKCLCSNELLQLYSPEE